MTKVKLIGEDGNVFNLIGLVSKALKKDGKSSEAKEFSERAFKQSSYEDVLALISEFVEVEDEQESNSD